MKKILLALAVLVVGFTLTGFVINKQSSYDDKKENSWIYYKSVTAWYHATDSKTLYIYYKQGNGVRRYVCCETRYSGDELYNVNYNGMTIRENDLYRSSECNDYRRNYRYTSENGLFAVFYFNVDLPYMSN